MGLCSKAPKEPPDEYDPIPFKLRWRIKMGKRAQDPLTHREVIRLGSNHLLETHSAQTEYQALKLVDRHTSVPTYKVLNVFNRPEGKLVEYEAIPGKPLSQLWKNMDGAKKGRIVADLCRFVEQLRKMAPPKHIVIGDATLGAAQDTRFGTNGTPNSVYSSGGGKVGPFYSMEDFHRFERRGHPIEDFDESDRPVLEQCHEREEKSAYQLKFTHANICPQNVLVDDQGRVSALIGWQSSGWYPEYWEYTQMHHAAGLSFADDDHGEEEKTSDFADWLEMMKTKWPGPKYEDELRVDAILRSRFPSQSYNRPLSIRPKSPTSSELAKEQQEIDDKNTESTSG